MRLFKTLIALVLILMIMPMVSAQLTFEPEKPAELKVSCIDVDKDLCNASTACNITVFYPNMTVFVDDGVMGNQGNYLNYTTPIINTRGQYSAVVNCVSGGTSGYTPFDFLVTSIPGNNQGFVAVGILLSLIALSFLFAYVGFIFSQSDYLFPIALFFILISLVLGVYVMHLGYLYNRDLLVSTMTSGTQFKVYLGIAYGLLGMAFIALTMLIVKTLKEFRERKSIQKYGPNYNTKTGMYN
jgi:hypothetical protein